MGAKKKLRVEVRVVPPGSLRPNPLNPHAGETPEQRREGMLRRLARALAAAARSVDRPPLTEADPQPPADGVSRDLTVPQATNLLEPLASPPAPG
jgi:hypothetical protein